MVIPLSLWEKHRLSWLPLDFQILQRFLTFFATLLDFLVALAVRANVTLARDPTQTLFQEPGGHWCGAEPYHLTPYNCSRVTQAPLGTLPGREQTGSGPDPPSAHPPGALPL